MDVASAGEAVTDVGDRVAMEGRLEAGGSSAHSLSSQKVDRRTLG